VEDTEVEDTEVEDTEVEDTEVEDTEDLEEEEIICKDLDVVTMGGIGVHHFGIIGIIGHNGHLICLCHVIAKGVVL
jgi:hypothetical protein